MASLYPQNLKAIHLNLVASSPPPVSSPLAFVTFLIKHLLGWYTKQETEGLQRSQDFVKEGMGYYSMQTTRPQTLAYSLADSPVGLLGWILDKLHAWSDEWAWTDEEVCTWASLYWFSTAGPTASLNMYYESIRGESEPVGKGKLYLHGTKLVGFAFPRPRGMYLNCAGPCILPEGVYPVTEGLGKFSGRLCRVRARA